MNKSLSSKSTARRKAFSKRWCLQREVESVKEQHPDKKQKQSSNLKHILWLKMDRWIGQRYTLLSAFSLHTNTHLDPHKPLHTKLSIIELRVAGPPSYYPELKLGERALYLPVQNTSTFPV